MLEPPRLPSLGVECLASAGHHGRLSGRLAAGCDAVLVRDTLVLRRHVAPSAPSLMIVGNGMLIAVVPPPMSVSQHAPG